MFKRLLVPLDGSERAEQALPVAARIARGSGGSVILLQVVDTTAFSYHYLGAYHVGNLFETSLDEARKYLTDVAASDIFTGVPTEIHHSFGSVSSQILLVAESTEADSIVITSRGYTGMARWVLGSVAEYVVRHASLPVLLLYERNVLDGDLQRGDEPGVRILVPLDGSFLAKAALEPAASLLSSLTPSGGGTLCLTRVVKPGKTASKKERKNPIHEAEQYLRVIADQVREELLPRSEAHKLRVTWSVTVHQNAAEGIISAAENGEHAGGDDRAGSHDVIAMATNGRSGPQRWVMGSVTEGVLAKTRLPLLVVRPIEQTDENPAQTPEREFPLTLPGVANPQHYMMAVIDDVKEAQDAVQALYRAGIPAEDIRVFERHEVVEYAEQAKRERGLYARLTDVFQIIVSDDDAHVRIYVEEALRGHAILNIYAPTSEQAERVKDILVDHHARIIKYFGRWAITVLHH